MKNILTNKYVILSIRLSLGLFLIYASISKINHPSEFAQAIRAYEIIPDNLSTLPAIFLPWLELFCGMLLITGMFTQSSAYISLSMLFLFTVIILIALLKGLEIDCGCGASLSGIEKVSWGKIFENSVLISLLYLLTKQKLFIFAIENILQSKK